MGLLFRPDPAPTLPTSLDSGFDLCVVEANNVNMDTAEQKLEQAFLTLPTLRHVGMALWQFVCGIAT